LPFIIWRLDVHWILELQLQAIPNIRFRRSELRVSAENSK
jgi:hypothetical protein